MCNSNGVLIPSKESHTTLSTLRFTIETVDGNHAHGTDASPSLAARATRGMARRNAFEMNPSLPDAIMDVVLSQ